MTFFGGKKQIFLFTKEPRKWAIIVFTLLTGFASQIGFSAVAGAGEQVETVDFSFFSSASKETKINDICCRHTLTWKKPRTKGLFNKSFGPDPVWVKIRPLKRTGALVFGLMVDEVEFYRVDAENKPVLLGVSGDSVAANKRQILSSSAVFPIGQDEVGKPLFLRIVQANSISFKLTFMSLQMFMAMDRHRNIVRAGFFGAVVMIVSFNLVVSFVARQPLFFYNACTILSMLGLNVYMTGVGAAYIWPQAPWLSNYVLPASISSAIIFGAIFTRAFLQRTGKQNISVIYILIPIVLTLMTVVAHLFFPPWQLMPILLSLIVLLFTGITVGMTFLAVKGHRRARVFLFPFFLAILPGFLIYTLNRTFGIQIGGSAPYLMEITLCAEALFFSLALSTIIRDAEKERADVSDKLAVHRKTAGYAMLAAVDNERARIASDLHDTAGHGLMMIANRLSELAKKINPAESLHQQLTETAAFSKTTINDIRRISHDLHPAAIEHLGWHQAVKNLFDNLSSTHNITVDLDIRVEESLLDETRQIHVYRIIQEIVSNIAHHSKASKCTGQITSDGQTVLIRVCDDGIYSAQPDPGSSLAQNGVSLGKTIIGYRTEALSGQWRFEPAMPGLCTSIEFPVSSEQATL
jgi:signal transduction histidine kinase